MQATLQTRHAPLIDTHQSFYQLAAIQLTGVTSLPVLLVSTTLIQTTSFINSVIILVLANIFLWAIRYFLIAMSFKNRKSVMDLTEEYFGNILPYKNFGIHSIAILLLLSTLFLFIEETTLVASAVTGIFRINEGPNIDPFMQISVVIGIISTIFCARGIVALRLLATISLPIILLAILALLILTPSKVDVLAHEQLSLAGLSHVLAINLAVTADLPTFFRHSQSWKTSVSALTTIQLTSFILGIAGLFLGKILPIIFESSLPGGAVVLNFQLISVVTVLLILSSICANVYNVYGASVGWEVFCSTPFGGKMVGGREYLILGFLLTLFFLTLTGLISFAGPVDISGQSLINLSFVFVIAYLIRKNFRQELDDFARNLYFLAWLLSTLVNVLQYFDVCCADVSVLLLGLGMIVLTILVGYALKWTIKAV